MYTVLHVVARLRFPLMEWHREIWTEDAVETRYGIYRYWYHLLSPPAGIT